MKKCLRVLGLVVATMMPFFATAQNHSITVANGTATNVYVPVYGFYAETWQHSQTIYPASMIEAAVTDEAITGSAITSITYYLASPANLSWGATFQVKLMEVPGTTLAAFANTSLLGQTVYTGVVNGTGSTMTITFDQPYVYNGGNLLVDFSTVTAGMYSSASFYGISTTQNTSWKALSGEGDGQYFIPKATFTYTGGAAITCYSVRNLHVDSSSATTISLGWTDNNNTSATYTVYNASDTSLIASGITGTSYTVTGLTPNTQYDFIVETDCPDNDTSLWVGVSGHTDCSLEAYPYITGFENMDINIAPRCWEVLGGNIFVHENTPNAYEGDKFLHFQGSLHNLIVLPEMADELEGKQLRFMTRPEGHYSYCGALQAGYITNLADTTTFVPLVELPVSEWEFDLDYHEVIVWFDGVPTGARAALCQNSLHSNFYWFVDDVNLEAQPSCVHPLNLIATDATPTTISLAWTDHKNTGATYTIYNYADSSVVATGITDTAYTITGLVTDTLYTFAVSADCSPTEHSHWTVIEVRTECLPQGLPYYHDFSGVPLGEHPFCWEHVSHSGSSMNVCNVNSIAPFEGTTALFFNYSSPSGNTIVLPEFTTPITNLRMRFMHRSESLYGLNGNLEVGYITNPGDPTSFVTVATLDRTMEYTRAIVDFTTSVAPANARMALRHVGNNNNNYWVVDALHVEVPPACLEVSDLVLESMTDTSATVSWENRSATAYQVIARPGNTMGSSVVDPSLWVASAIVTDTFYTFNGLTPNGDYIIQVRSICGSDSSLWSSPMALHVGYCVPTPSSVDAQGITNVTFGMDEVVNNSQRPTTAPYYGNYSNLIGSLPAGMDADVAITYATGYTYGTIVWIDWNRNMIFEDNEIVYTGTSTYVSPTTLHASFHIPATQDTGVYRMRIAGADDGFDAFISTGEGDHDPCGGGTYRVYMDFSVRVIPPLPCAEVSDITVNNITGTGATVHWSHSGEATFTILDGSTVVATGLTGNSYTFTDLVPATHYAYSIVANCAAGDAADAVEFSFSTACSEALPLPFVEGFSDLSGTRNCWILSSGNLQNDITFIENDDHFELRFSSASIASNNNYNQYAYSPEIDAADATALKVEIVYRTQTTNEHLFFGYEIEGGTHIWGSEGYFTENATTHARYTAILPANARRVAIHYYTPVDAYWAYIDSVIVTPYVVDTVTLSSADNTMGRVSPSGVTVVPAGESFTATATPNARYHFEAWMEGDNVVSYQNPYTFVPTRNIDLVATFAPDIEYYTITINYDSTKGNVIGTGTYSEGTVVTITAIPFEGYEFRGWVEGVDVYDNNPYTFTLTSDRTLNAIFSELDGIDGVEESLVMLFPNPASSDVTVRVSQPSVLTLLDLQGRTVIPSTQINSTFTIQYSSLPAGTYFVRIADDKNTVVRKLIIR